MIANEEHVSCEEESNVEEAYSDRAHEGDIAASSKATHKTNSMTTVAIIRLTSQHDDIQLAVSVSTTALTEPTNTAIKQRIRQLTSDLLKQFGGTQPPPEMQQKYEKSWNRSFHRLAEIAAPNDSVAQQKVVDFGIESLRQHLGRTRLQPPAVEHQKMISAIAAALYHVHHTPDGTTPNVLKMSINRAIYAAIDTLEVDKTARRQLYS